MVTDCGAKNSMATRALGEVPGVVLKCVVKSSSVDNLFCSSTLLLQGIFHSRCPENSQRKNSELQNGIR